MKILQKAAPVFVAGAAILWGILVIFVKQLSGAGLFSMEIVTLRVYGSALILAVGLFLYNKKLLRIRLKDSWCFVGTGVISIVFFSYCYFNNVTVSSVAVSTILMYTSPIWVTVISRFVFGEKIGKTKIAALCMTVAGCALVSGVTDGIGAVSLGICYGSFFNMPVLYPLHHRPEVYGSGKGGGTGDPGTDRDNDCRSGGV